MRNITEEWRSEKELFHMHMVMFQWGRWGGWFRLDLNVDEDFEVVAYKSSRQMSGRDARISDLRPGYCTSLLKMFIETSQWGKRREMDGMRSDSVSIRLRFVSSSLSPLLLLGATVTLLFTVNNRQIIATCPSRRTRHCSFTLLQEPADNGNTSEVWSVSSSVSGLTQFKATSHASSSADNGWNAKRKRRVT
jgi:hypothetical protein